MLDKEHNIVCVCLFKFNFCACVWCWYVGVWCGRVCVSVSVAVGCPSLTAHLFLSGGTCVSVFVAV